MTLSGPHQRLKGFKEYISKRIFTFSFDKREICNVKPYYTFI